MPPAHARASTIVFEDGLGQRHHAMGGVGELLEILTLRPDLTAVPSFEFALRERVARLAPFHSESFPRIRSVERVDASSTLALVSDCAEGVRLSKILAVADTRRLPIDTNAAMFLIRQLVAAVASLHEQLPGVFHGAIAPERIVILPSGRLVVVEHALGAALQQLHYTQERYWTELRMAVPSSVALPMLDACADVLQIGTVALALFLGRPLKSREYPLDIAELAGEATLTTPVRAWLTRALQLDPIGSFSSAIEARAAFNDIPGCDIAAERQALKKFLSQSPNQPASSPKHPKVSTPPSEIRKPSRPAPPPPPPRPAAAAPASAAPPVSSAPPPPKPAMRSDAVSPRRRRLGAALFFVVLASGGGLAARYLIPDPIDTSGTLAVSTTPAGIAVFIDGRPRGVTPINARLAAGAHVLEIGREKERRRIPVTILPGSHVTHFIDMPAVTAAAGSLEITSEPAGASITVDGEPHGTAPRTVEGLSPGMHTVVLENDLGKVTHEVTIEPGVMASLVVPMRAPAGAPVSGWIAVNAPAELHIYKGQRLLGTTKSDRIMVAAGDHHLELVNEDLGYRTTRSVKVEPGKVASIRPSWPKGSLALNAVPWADVFINGERIGETPIGNVEVPIGAHEIVFRHPTHGEKRAQAVVSLKEPTRVSVDMRK
jgi:hypothetical protein